MDELRARREAERLRAEVERRLERRSRPKDLESLLRQLFASPGSDADTRAFARRQLAELLLESQPWLAALELRQLLLDKPEDDSLLALMGLAQALLSNFRASTGAYRRALQADPHNPWYLHNLGHILDIGLDRPEEALPPLQRARQLEAGEHEIRASLAHCLARLGRIETAREELDAALAAAPNPAVHRDLADWLRTLAGQQQGAPDAVAPKTTAAGTTARHSRRMPQALEIAGNVGRRSTSARGRARGRPSTGNAEPARSVDGDLGTAVHRSLRDSMDAAGYNPLHVRAAQHLWRDFASTRLANASEASATTVSAYAAATEYAVARLFRQRGVTQRAVAARYGVGVRSVSRCYAGLRAALSLTERDPSDFVTPS